MMESKKKAFSLYDIVMIGLMAAVVFVVNMFLSIRIPTPTGTTMIKLANAFVLLCGLLLGPVRGGLAAGIGSFRAGLAARSGAQQQAQAEGKGGCTFDIHL